MSVLSSPSSGRQMCTPCCARGRRGERGPSARRGARVRRGRGSIRESTLPRASTLRGGWMECQDTMRCVGRMPLRARMERPFMRLEITFSCAACGTVGTHAARGTVGGGAGCVDNNGLEATRSARLGREGAGRRACSHLHVSAVMREQDGRAAEARGRVRVRPEALGARVSLVCLAIALLAAPPALQPALHGRGGQHAGARGERPLAEGASRAPRGGARGARGAGGTARGLTASQP